MSRPLRLLIAEDNPADADLVLRELRRADFAPEWQRVETEEEYLKVLESGPDIILSDYAMPQFSGLLSLELLKKSGRNIPFIIISGTIGEDVAVEVMKSGASDYLIKDRLTRLGLAVSHALEQCRLRIERTRAESIKRRQAEELAARCDELERFNTVAVGRELRMIELKREINELCERLGEQPRYAIAEIKTTRATGEASG